MINYDCATCGRSYDDATPEEVVRWTVTGYCCMYCVEDNREPETDHVENAHANLR